MVLFWRRGRSGGGFSSLGVALFTENVYLFWARRPGWSSSSPRFLPVAALSPRGGCVGQINVRGLAGWRWWLLTRFLVANQEAERCCLAPSRHTLLLFWNLLCNKAGLMVECIILYLNFGSKQPQINTNILNVA